LRALRALSITEERELAGRVAGVLYLTGAITVSLLPLMPGMHVRHVPILLGIAALGALWGLACLFAIPWQRAHPLVSHFSSASGFPLTAVAMALSGGSQSPARFYILFIVFYCSYFYPPREALPYLVGCVVVLMLPLTYDHDAVSDGLLGELLVVTPTIFVTGRMVTAGKQVMLGLSSRDPLTGLLNRRAFNGFMREQLGGRRSTGPIGLLMVDLDDFKGVNTRHGHPAGDEVLRQTGLGLRSAVRSGDVVARLGGDEFALVVPGADEASMRRLASRIPAELARARARLDLGDYQLTASLGWALAPRDAGSPDDLVEAADASLRGAKADQKGAGKAPGLPSPHWLPELAG
jgi:diguanylate cyclase (GGDEF)-like protein